MNKNIFLILLLICLFCCEDKYNNNKNHELIKNIKSLNNHEIEIKYLLAKNNLTTPHNLILNDNNYYYLLSKLFYNNNTDNKLNDWFDYCIEKSIKTDNIFKKDALKFYINYLADNEKWNLIKKVINENIEILTDKEDEIYLKYAENNSFIDINYIPNNLEIFPILHQIIKKQPSDLNNFVNQKKIENYIIESKLYYNHIYQSKNNNINEDKLINEKIKLIEIIEYCKDNYFLSCLSSYINKDKNKFILNLDFFLNNTDQITYDKLELIRKLSVMFGLRKDFYTVLSKHYNNNIYSTYFYGVEVIYYVNYSKGLKILQDTLSKFDSNSIINYNIRGMALSSSFNLSKKWFNEFTKYYNDYPDYIRSNQLLNTFFRQIILYKKNDLFIDIIRDFPITKMEPKDKVLFYYYLYLIDKKNKKKWKQNILKEFPLSFSALTLNNGAISIENKNLLKTIKTETKLSKTTKIKISKIKYFLDFYFLKEAQNISLDDLTDNEKVIVYDLFYNYLINENDYYLSLRYARYIISILYDDNFDNIDDLDILKRLYPPHYKNLILKYSKQYNIEPACAFAVMREESNFKNDIVSYQSAVGLMQIMPPTGKFISQKLKINNYDLTNPEDNINMGTFYLNFLQRYFNKKEYILASYNAGPGRTKQWYNTYNSFSDEIKLELIPIPETRNYVRKVMKSYFIYDYLIENHYN